jgi:hypothetical protein
VKTAADGFPELYNLWLTVAEFPCQNLVFKNAKLILHRSDTEGTACDYDFATLIRGYHITDSWINYPRRFILYDLFTRDETAAIEAYLVKHHFLGITLHTVRQSFPIPNHLAPCNAASYGAWEGEYRFDGEERFDCPVKFWGYYWLGETPVVAGLAGITCESDGSIAIDGLASPSILRLNQADMLCKAWLTAKTLGKAQRVILRYDLPPDRLLSEPAPTHWRMIEYGREANRRGMPMDCCPLSSFTISTEAPAVGS